MMREEEIIYFRIIAWRLGGHFRKLRTEIVVGEIVNMQFRKTWKGSSLYIPDPGHLTLCLCLPTRIYLHCPYYENLWESFNILCDVQSHHLPKLEGARDESWDLVFAEKESILLLPSRQAGFQPPLLQKLDCKRKRSR